MKKLLNISVIAALAILPMAANATPIYDVTSADPGATNASGPEAQNAPKYSLAAAGANDDDHMATAGYVKGAYNAAIKAINKVATTAGNAADKDLSNLSATGTGVITSAVTSGAAGGTYSNTTSGLTATTIQGAIDELADNAGDYATQDGVKNTIETATITATVPTLTTWGNDSSTGTVDVDVSSIAATYAEPSNP